MKIPSKKKKIKGLEKRLIKLYNENKKLIDSKELVLDESLKVMNDLAKRKGVSYCAGNPDRSIRVTFSNEIKDSKGIIVWELFFNYDNTQTRIKHENRLFMNMKAIELLMKLKDQ